LLLHRAVRLWAETWGKPTLPYFLSSLLLTPLLPALCSYSRGRRQRSLKKLQLPMVDSKGASVGQKPSDQEHSCASFVVQNNDLSDRRNNGKASLDGVKRVGIRQDGD
jgi:hypothetical protein